MVDKKVVVYSTPTCPYCKRAKDYLSRKGIRYTDINVAQNRKELEQILRVLGLTERLGIFIRFT